MSTAELYIAFCEPDELMRDLSVEYEFPWGTKRYACEGGGFDFEAVYGAVGRGYIEAHHLTPLAESPEDTPVSLNPKTDFAVLCANCHRMMNRRDGPQSIDELRALAQVGAMRRFLVDLRNRQ